MSNNAKETNNKREKQRAKARLVISAIQVLLSCAGAISIIISIILFGINTVQIDFGESIAFQYQTETTSITYGIVDIILLIFTIVPIVYSIYISCAYYYCIKDEKDDNDNAILNFLILLVPVLCCIPVVNFNEFAYMYGYIFGNALIIMSPVFLYNTIKLIPYLIAIIKENNLESKARTQKRRELLIKQKQEATYQNIISKTGKKFFVKNFPILKNWNETDILDEIKDIPYEQKVDRITNAKLLFANKWDERFVREIANSSTTEIDETTIKMAQAIIDVYYKK